MIFKTYTFPMILDNKRKFFQILSEKIQRVCPTRKLQVPKKFFGQFFYKVILLIFLGPWPKVSRGFVRRISASLSKPDSQFQKKLSGDFFFLCKNYNLLLSFENRAEKIRLTVEKKSAGLSSCFLPPHWNNLKKKFLKSFCIFCWLFSDQFR